MKLSNISTLILRMSKYWPPLRLSPKPKGLLIGNRIMIYPNTLNLVFTVTNYH